MFNSLSDNLNNIFSKLKRRGFLSEEDVNTAMREIRIALLEADVALPVAKDFINRVKEKAIGQEVIKSISPAQMVVKIVNDELTEILRSDSHELNLATTPPAVIMMVGLQGSGKTTSSAKIAMWLEKNKNKKVLMASLDTYRPAAQEQLETLGKQTNVTTVPIIKEQKATAITERAMDMARKEAYDIVILDTAGRLHIDDDLMNELKNVQSIAKPIETLLVADSLTGQDAVNIARSFNEQIGLTGIVLTRIDGDGRGGAALSMKAVTGCPIKFLGSGEKLHELETFHPDRIASRILGMGDIVSLVEKAAENVDEEEAKKMTRKMKKGQFDFNDLKSQIKQMKKMGGMGSIMGMIPGLGKIKKQLDEANMDEKIFVQMEAVINSMTKKERSNPKLINPSRKKRIAAGSGTDIQLVNRIIKQQKQMGQMMKKFSKMDKKSLMRSGLGQMLKGKGIPNI